MLNIESAVRANYPALTNYPAFITRPVIALFKALSHEKEVNAFLASHHQAGIPFVDAVLEHLDVSSSANQQELENIPCIGKVIIVANHPMGAIDSFSLIQLVSQMRQNGKVKILANAFLMHTPQMQDMLIPVDNMSGKISRESFRQIEDALAHDEAVIIFPAGEVSRFRPWGVRDQVWKAGFLKLAKRNQTPVLPVYIKARNSVLFYLVSMIYKPFATVLLPHEMLKARKSRLKITVGELVHERAFLRSTLPLKQHAKLFRKHLYRIAQGKPGIYATEKCIARPERRQLIRQELRNSEMIGKTSDGKAIYLVGYSSAPVLVREVGRLREYTFRKVDEGTGGKRDIDSFDAYYRHIVLWDDDELEVVGAYRVGECGKIMHETGTTGLYMKELCTFSEAFCNEVLPHAIELGRSFVQPRYWGSRALDYLWQGIGAYLKHHPEVTHMYGPVSISHSYPKAARDALVYFYLRYFASDEQYMTALTPYRLSDLTLDEMDAYFMGSDYAENFKMLRSYLKALDVGVPTLFKQYGDLCEAQGVRFFDFGLDKDFGDCIDGYLLVDIHRIKDSKRKRYIGTPPLPAQYT